ncbi:hypothetical protein I6I99_21270 [Sphingobacterium multivorum]|nr:hypothetical protein [Sphingobacterium multivorum]QQT29848.1 hypothetical protein I6I99_21270 [Sphingobacterium multivorum]
MKSNESIYKKWWFWVLIIFFIYFVKNSTDGPKKLAKYKDRISVLDLTDTVRALHNLDIIYKELESDKDDNQLASLRDTIKTIMISLGKDPDYVAPKIITKESIMINDLSEWDGSLPAFVDVIKEDMNDPDSFEHIKTYYRQSKKDSPDFIITMYYRGKNAFGAKIKVGNSCVYNVDTKQIRDVE